MIKLLLTIVFCCLPVSATTFYVAPTGLSGNTGAIGSPWDLQTALSQASGAIHAGDTIYLRGGTYAGTFTSYLVGTAGNLVTVRSYPGEWAVIDGGTTYAVTLQLNTAGAYTIYRDFEVMKSDPARTTAQFGSSPTDISRGSSTGVNVFASNVKCINLIVHDDSLGFGFWSTSINSEFYGCLLYNNGWIGGDRTHGHNIYAQNNTGIKTIKDNISLNAFDYGFHIYGSSAASLTGFYNEGNVVWNSPILIGGDGPADNITFNSNYLYLLEESIGNGIDFGFHDHGNGTLVAQNNYLYAVIPLAFHWWANLTATGNTVLAGNGLFNTGVAVYLTTPTGSPTTVIDNNTYWHSRTGDTNDFYKDGSSYYLLQTTPVTGTWKDLGFDVNSSYNNGGNFNVPAFPSSPAIFVRPNAYQDAESRDYGHIIIYNWPHSATVSVNLSTTGLTNGQYYELRNAANYFGAPVLTGVYASVSPTVSVPMTTAAATAVANPVGLGSPRHVTTAPEFTTLVVTPTISVGLPAVPTHYLGGKMKLGGKLGAH